MAVFPAAAVTACSHPDKPAASVVGDCKKADVVGRAAQAGAFLEVGAAVVFATGEWHMEEGSLQACYFEWLPWAAVKAPCHGGVEMAPGGEENSPLLP